jgi:hypothetical protein
LPPATLRLGALLQAELKKATAAIIKTTFLIAFGFVYKSRLCLLKFWFILPVKSPGVRSAVQFSQDALGHGIAVHHNAGGFELVIRHGTEKITFGKVSV